MTFPTHEQYDENEYFIKFLKIHPYLSYANTTMSKKKLEFQINLLNKLNDEIINIEQLRASYNKLIKKELEETIKIGDLTLKYQTIIKESKNNSNDEIINFINEII